MLESLAGSDPQGDSGPSVLLSASSGGVGWERMHYLESDLGAYFDLPLTLGRVS